MIIKSPKTNHKPKQPLPHVSMLLLMLVKYPQGLPWESQRTDHFNSLHFSRTKEKPV